MRSLAETLGPAAPSSAAAWPRVRGRYEPLMPGRSSGEGRAMELPGQRPLPEEFELPKLTTRLDGATRIRTEILVPLALSFVAVAAVFVLAGVVAIRSGEHAAGTIAVLGAAGAAGAMIWIAALLER